MPDSTSTVTGSGTISSGILPNPRDLVTAAVLNVGPGAATAGALLNVGPESNPPGTLPDPTRGTVAGVWGYYGERMNAPQQTNSPPIPCGVFGQGGVVPPGVTNYIGNAGVVGVSGYSGIPGDIATARGTGVTNVGVAGFGDTTGVIGASTIGPGVAGTSNNGDGVYGFNPTSAGSGVHGCNGLGAVPGVRPKNGCGVFGESNNSEGVFAASATQHGVHGVNGAGNGRTPTFGCGVWGDSDNGYGVFGASKTSNAGQFEGNVAVTGNVAVKGNVTATGVFTAGADCAEEFNVAGASLSPGTVAVLDEQSALSECSEPYDKRVARVISGAGEYRPGIVLDRRASSENRAAVALIGKVCCKVDATYAPIKVGDLISDPRIRDESGRSV